MMKSRWVRFSILGLLSVALLVLLASNLFVEVVRGKSTSIPLTDQLTPEQKLAQDLALKDRRVFEYTRNHRSEVFGVHLVYPDQYTEASAACAYSDCRQVEIYNFDENVAITAIVDIEQGKVLDVLRLPGMHPGINKRLNDLALELAYNAPEVIEILGYKPEIADMAPVESTLVGTACDAGHLCAGPTFRIGNRILWAIVDLTDEKFVGTNWTDVVTDIVEHAPYVPEGCPPAGSASRDGWTLDYAVTGSDGLRVYNAYYNGTQVLNSVKLVEWHADYGSSGYVDATGCSPSGGFPISPYGDTQVLDLIEDSNVVGFEVVQDFRMSNWGQSCNYRYEQHIMFYTDGRFRTVSAAYGKGCGTNAMYRPLVRIDLAINGDAGDSFARWNGSQWNTLNTEDYLTPYSDGSHGPHQITAEGYSWRVIDQSGTGYYLVQDMGQFPNGEGDNPFLYATLYHSNEGETDLGAVGTCCNDTHQQGPHQYVNGENIANQNLVLWYVPQSPTDATAPDYYCWTVTTSETYPCFSGPMFVPISPVQAPEAGFSHSQPTMRGQPVTFTNLTTGGGTLTYLWDFNDGTTSTEVNPVHTFANSRLYNVTLTATNEGGSDSQTITIPVVTLGPRPTPGPTPTNSPNE